MSTDHSDGVAGAPLLPYCKGDEGRRISGQEVLATRLD